MRPRNNITCLAVGLTLGFIGTMILMTELNLAPNQVAATVIGKYEGKQCRHLADSTFFCGGDTTITMMIGGGK